MFRVGTGLSGALSALLNQQPVTPAKVEFAWRRAAGPALANISTIRLRDEGTLEVEVETRQWKGELDRASALRRDNRSQGAR